MKILSILTLGLLVFTNIETNNSNEFECFISTNKEIYEIGETPEITVTIKNNSGKDVYLIGSLDASEYKWRSPYCYFEINKPNNISSPILKRCGNMNSLRKEDFKLVKSGQSFDPYQSIDDYGFFSSNEIKKKENFQAPGKYKITFYYSTKSTELSDYRGHDNQKNELKKLLNKTPNIELISNTIEIEIKK